VKGTSSVTDGGRGGGGRDNAPLSSSDVSPFSEMGPLRLPLLPKQFYKVLVYTPPLVYTKLFFATAAVSCKALHEGVKMVFLLSFYFEKRMADRCQ